MMLPISSPILHMAGWRDPQTNSTAEAMVPSSDGNIDPAIASERSVS